MAEPAKTPPSLGLTGTGTSLSGLSFGALPAFPSAAPKGDAPSASSFFGASLGTASMAPLPSKLFPSDDKPMGTLFSGISLPKDPLKPGALFGNQENQISPFGANQTSAIPASSLFGTPLSNPAKVDSIASKSAAASTAYRAASSLRTSAMSFPPTVASDPSLFAPKPSAPKESAKPLAEVTPPAAAAAKPKAIGLPAQVTQTINRWNAAINGHLQQALIQQQHLQTKESQLLASRSRIEDLRGDVRGAQDTAATVQAELDRSWKELAHLEGLLAELESKCADLKPENTSEERNAMLDVAEDLISNLNSLAAEGGSVLSSVRTQEAEVCHSMYAEKNLQEMLYEQEQLLQSIDHEIRLLSSSVQLASNPTPSTQPQISSPVPSLTPQLLRARSTQSRSILSPLYQRSPSLSLPVSASFGE